MVANKLRVLAVIFLLFIFTFKVGKSYKNSIDYAGGTSNHCNDNFHYHVSLLQSSIPACTGRVLETKTARRAKALPKIYFTTIYLYCKPARKIERWRLPKRGYTLSLQYSGLCWYLFQIHLQRRACFQVASHLLHQWRPGVGKKSTERFVLH